MTVIPHEGGSKDHLAWAQHPASDTAAAAAVLALAKTDHRFAPIARVLLLEDGVIIRLAGYSSGGMMASR